MHGVFFWKSWSQSYRITLYVLGAVFFVSLLFLWLGYFQGADAVIHWEKFQEQKVVETTVHEFRLGPFVLNVTGDSYAILEYFNVSHIVPNTTASYTFLLVITITAIMLLALITILPRFWYFMGMTLFIVFLVSLRFEVLGIAGYYNRAPAIVVLLMYVLPAFYFKHVNTSISLVS